MELARLIGESQANVAYWEKSSKPPRSDVLPKMARVLGVRVEDLLGVGTPARTPSRPAVGKVQRVFDEVRRLPRRQQDKVVEVVAALLEQYKRAG
jgi:transcriptional regulator with XRE-family HTH domain